MKNRKEQQHNKKSVYNKESVRLRLDNGHWTGCTKKSESRFKEQNGADINIESKEVNYVQYKSKCASKNIYQNKYCSIIGIALRFELESNIQNPATYI